MISRRFSSIFKRNLSSVRIVEVGPRDGLQNEAKILPTATKIEFINRLSQTGLKTIEATSFVSAKWIPQMKDNVEVMNGIKRADGVTYSAIVPNMKGFQDALDTNTTEIGKY
jgi:hydroxymethylglutaryl-CoA lyase